MIQELPGIPVDRVAGARCGSGTGTGIRKIRQPRKQCSPNGQQLLNHGFGLVTEAERRGKSPVQLHLFAEPTKGRDISAKTFADHRSEIASFAAGVSGATVRFSACSWREWLARFPRGLADHADRLIARFHP